MQAMDSVQGSDEEDDEEPLSDDGSFASIDDLEGLSTISMCHTRLIDCITR